MDVIALLHAGRAKAEEIMVDTCEIRGPSTGGTFDESTGKLTGGTGAVLYSGPCRRVRSKRFEQQVNSGGRTDVEARNQIHLPMSAAHIAAGSVATVTASPEDPNSVGQRWYVLGPSSGSLTTTQQLNVMAVVG